MILTPGIDALARLHQTMDPSKWNDCHKSGNNPET